jgi:hypothetical protein
MRRPVEQLRGFFILRSDPSPRGAARLTIDGKDRVAEVLRMMDELVGQKVVIDMRSTFVCFGTITRVDVHVLELRDADIHDLRDTETSRENYVAESKATGIKRNRRKALIARDDIVAIARLDDVVDK